MRRVESGDRDEGFSLIELLAALLIVAVLIAIALPSLLRQREQAHETITKASLTSAAHAEAAYVSLEGEYAASGDLAAYVPELDVTGIDDDDIHVTIGDVDPGDGGQVLLYARAESGDWFGLRLVQSGAEVGRHTCASDDVSDMTLVDCSGTTW